MGVNHLFSPAAVWAGVLSSYLSNNSAAARCLLSSPRSHKDSDHSYFRCPSSPSLSPLQVKLFRLPFLSLRFLRLNTAAINFPVSSPGPSFFVSVNFFIHRLGCFRPLRGFHIFFVPLPSSRWAAAPRFEPGMSKCESGFPSPQG